MRQAVCTPGMHSRLTHLGCHVLTLPLLAVPPLFGVQGTGKSATIRSLLGQEQPAGYRETNRVRQLAGQWVLVDVGSGALGCACHCCVLAAALCRQSAIAWRRMCPDAVWKRRLC